MIYLITGGARSGKSNYAQQQALAATAQPLYIATAKIGDDEFRERVSRHKQDRSTDNWINMEEPLYISRLEIDHTTAVIDCVTLWLTNIFALCQQDVTQSLAFVRNEIDGIAAMQGHYFIVTNEIGMGLHADSEIGRKFTDLQGWTNQYIAQKAGKVVLMVSGIPVVIKH